MTAFNLSVKAEIPAETSRVQASLCEECEEATHWNKHCVILKFTSLGVSVLLVDKNYSLNFDLLTNL